MLDTYYFLSLAFNCASIILGLLGLFLVIKNWQVWRETNLDVIKARAFLDKKFLNKNWFYLVLVGGIIMSRRVYRYLELSSNESVEVGVTELLFDFLGFFVIFILVTMAFHWYQIIHTHS